MANPKYTKWIENDGLTLLNGWARDGLTDEQVAHNCGINVATLYRWKNDHCEISEALKKGKEVVDYEVENALYNKCIGYYVDEDIAFKCKRVYWDDNDRRCEEEEIKTVTVKKYIPPDTTAQLAWLNNRRPDKFRRNANKEKLDEKRFDEDKRVNGLKYF